MRGGVLKRALPAIVVCAVALGAADVPRLEPLTGAPPSPPDNPSTPEKVQLGEKLFFENLLSGEQRRSCGTCHKPQLLFTDGFTRAWGLHESELSRKTPNLLNVGWQRSMFFDGREKTLEDQASKPLENHLEMDLDPEAAAQRVRRDPRYRRVFDLVFPGEPITFPLIAKAIAAYERTLVSYDSDLDRYLLGDESALGDAAKRGMELFTGRAGCIRCHHGPLLSDHQLHYTGVPEREGDSPPGTKYKAASLRDVTRRYSFMHNGYFVRMEQVLDHYTRGGSAPEGAQSEVAPLSLAPQERSDLMAFLKSLNGRLSQLLDASARDYDVFDIKPEEDASNKAKAAVED